MEQLYLSMEITYIKTNCMNKQKNNIINAFQYVKVTFTMEDSSMLLLIAQYVLDNFVIMNKLLKE
jgi:hypothetical protein